MEFNILAGSKKERTTKVSHNQTTSFLWEGENVFSTPSMISEMEETCRLLLKEQFLSNDKELDSVGTIVNVKHLSATPVGAEILLKAEIASVDGRRVLFKVSAEDKLELIGEGQHERFVINIPRFRDKFNQKVRGLGSR